MANERTILNLSPEAVAVIDKLAPSPNKRGAWVSKALVEYAQLLSGDRGDAGILERIEKKLDLLLQKAN